MMQTIQNEASQQTTISIESHHIVITATCFEILVCLLRVLEMVMVQARPLFTDPAFPNAANMLERLAQVLNSARQGGYTQQSFYDESSAQWSSIQNLIVQTHRIRKFWN